MQPDATPSSRRVGIDATSLAVRGKGVARYLVELLPRLPGAAGAVEPVVLTAADAKLPAGAEGLERIAVRPRPASVWEQLGLPRAARTGQLSLLHTTSDRLPALPTVPVVLYLFEDPCHREALARRAGQSLRHGVAGALTRTLFPLSLRRAAVILVSSEATARDVEARGVPAERLRVVYPGVSEDFRPATEPGELAAIRARLGCPGGYVLHFSSDDPRDNSAVALQAYAELCRRRPSAPPLLVAGPVAAELPAQQRRAAELGVDGRVQWLGYQSGDALLELYRGASAYIDPSLFEGFGFQVAEALASGAPVVCSGTTSLPEVVGDAGILLAPDDVRGFADALDRVLAGAGDGLRERGPRRAARFRWERTAAETVAVWEELLR